MKNRKIATCIICGLTVSIFFQSTPYCRECHREKHEHLPGNNYETSFLSSNYRMSTSGLNISASPSPEINISDFEK